MSFLYVFTFVSWMIFGVYFTIFEILAFKSNTVDHVGFNQVIGFSAFHYITGILLIIFFIQKRKWFCKIRLDTFEQRGFTFIGIIAAIANILVNINSPVFGTKNVVLFIACLFQNTLLYIGLIFYIMILDSWNMSIKDNASKFDKLLVHLLFVSQLIVITYNIVLIIIEYIYQNQCDYSFLGVLCYRSWLIYFGSWKLGI